MSQVRKDILNGWKEIGGYLARDKRTVERWEKHRGLPVRRVPGTGRATVYALIAELDEWLTNSMPEEKDFAAAGTSSDTASIATSLETFGLVTISSVPDVVASVAAVVVPQQWGGPGSPGFVERRKLVAIETPAPWARHRIAAALATMAMAAGLLCVVAWPLARSHAKNVAGAEPARRIATVAGSRVQGVDALYLQGIYFYEQRTPESLDRSLSDLNAAIAKDPNYAPAYAALANTYNLLREYSRMPDAEAYPKAKAAAEHAIALDPKLPDAHASLGFVDFFWSWDSAAAEREFHTALALDPSSVLAHHWYGSMLMHEGKFNEALDQLDIAQRLQPTSAAILSTRALAMGLSGHRGEAVDMMQDVLKDTPSATSPHAILETLSRQQPRNPAQFVLEMHKVAELRHSDELLHVADAAGHAYRSGGENAMWTAILTEEERQHPGKPKTYMMAEAEGSLGHVDEAMTDLTDLARERDPNVIGVLIDPSFEGLHRDPRFGQLVASIGLPPLQQ